MLDLAGHVVGLVVAGPDALLLDEGVDFALEKTALAAELHLDDGGVAGDAGEAHAVGGAEVAEAVGDEMALVDLDGADDVWAVAIDHVGAVVDAVVCELAQ